MSLAELTDQRSAVQILQRSLDRGRLGHAYLFSGPDLDLLEILASNLARTVNCLHPPQVGAGGLPLDCCDACASCRKIQRQAHADVHYLRPESKLRIITIDQVRQLNEAIHLKPGEGRYKVGIITAADRLNAEAGNAFLKTLEEPPGQSLLMLLSTEPGRMLETLVSRCLVLPVAGEIMPRLSPAQRQFLDRFIQILAAAQEGVWTRYRLLGLWMQELAEVKSAVEKSISERSPLRIHDDVDPRLKEKWEDELAAAIEAEYRRRRSDMILLLQRWMRDLWLCGHAIADPALFYPELADRTKAAADRMGESGAQENLRLLERLHRILETNVQEPLAIEVTCLKMAL